ncbi:LANO_0E14708g1_1 [Lachancea nothofagi CBS 11611]|uniref:LANO_0E14708g1_1 n=1 Tax=Lachancea nothofagi CBS 11611 TaxID=1266666 RepID=A0A1G4K0A0_9SACH|nr:LANO_0E14708g1_1 [Lachancea nothofagi CBS 11611]
MIAYKVWLPFWILGVEALHASENVPRGQDEKEDFPFTTVVDLLWQNVEFSTFLRKVQKCGKINYLNELDNFTLFAPINSAFSQNLEQFEVDDFVLHDCVLDPRQFDVGIHVLATNDSTPHLVDVRSDGSWLINDTPVLKDVLRPNMQNATLHGVVATVPRAPTFVGILHSLSQLSYFSKLVAVTESHNALTLFEHKTVFIPDNIAFNNQFSDLEIAYLLGDKNSVHENLRTLSTIDNLKKDRVFVLNKLVVDGLFGGRLHQTNITNLNGDLMIIDSHANGSAISVNGTIASGSNQLYNAGIAHIFSELDFLSHDLRFTAEKYLLGLGADRFVEEVHMRGLAHLINGEFEGPLTIFVPVETSNDSPGYSKSSLLYHFTDTSVNLTRDFSDETETRLYDSMFCSSNKRLGGQCQRQKIQRLKKHGDTEYLLNKKYRLKSDDYTTIGNTTIFSVEEEISLPGDLLSSVNPFSGCSKSLSFLRDLNLLDLRPNSKGYTVFLPCFDSWEYFDLNLDYLEHNISALNLIMKNYILNDLIYTDTEEQSFMTSNLYDENITISVLQSETDSEQIALSFNTIDEPVMLTKNFDTFFDQGVIHPMENVYFPDSLNITLQNLMDTANSFDFIEYLKSFDSLKMIFDQNQEFSLLVPTSQSLLLEDISLNSTTLEEFLKLHIILANSTQALLDCDSDISTLYGEKLSCRESLSNAHLLRLKDGVDKEVRIMKKGCSSSNERACVFVIDRPISLSWLDQDRYKIRLPGTAIAMGALLGILLIFGVLACTLVVVVRKRGTEGHQSVERSGEQDPLLRSPKIAKRGGYSSSLGRDPAAFTDRSNQVMGNPGPSPFAKSYSENSSRNPVSINQGSSHT